jgi:hypothetical protein
MEHDRTIRDERTVAAVRVLRARDLFFPIVGILLAVVCCAGPFILAGLGAAIALTALRAHFAAIVAPLAAVALIGAILVIRTRRS